MIKMEDNILMGYCPECGRLLYKNECYKYREYKCKKHRCKLTTEGISNSNFLVYEETPYGSSGAAENDMGHYIAKKDSKDGVVLVEIIG